jgi:hypothetical protein
MMTPERIKELRRYILRAQVFPLQLQECLEEIEKLQAASLDDIETVYLRVRELEIENTLLKSCLEKYADFNNWDEGSGGHADSDFRLCKAGLNGGQLAREALGRGD